MIQQRPADNPRASAGSDRRPGAGLVDSLVESVEVLPIRVPLRDDPAAAATHEAVVLVLHSGGMEGYGEATALPARGESLRLLAAELQAMTGRLLGRSLDSVLANSGGSAGAASALETAALDLVGRLTGRRVVDLLGDPARDRLECNLLVTGTAPGNIIGEVRAAVEAGFGAFKLKAVPLWRVNPNTAIRIELERLAAARWAAGADARLRIDFNGVLDPATCELALASLSQADLEMVEQPLAAGAPASEWLALAGWSRTPLAADESLVHPATAAALAGAGIGLAIKLSTIGGPRAAVALAGLAPVGTAVLLSSSMDSAVGIAAALHTACAIAGPVRASGLATRSRLAGDLATGLAPDSAWLELPPGPGLGVDLDRAAVEAYRTAV